MKYLKFILESNSNKELDLLSRKIVKIAKETGAVKAGPIPSKGKRIIFVYNPNIVTINRLLLLKLSKKVSTNVTELERKFDEQFYLDWN
jgi:ribosomal protein S10